MQLSLASESGSPRASNSILKENGQGNHSIFKRTPIALPESVLHLRSISSSSSQTSRMNKFSSTSSDDFDSKEPAILTENIGADNESDLVSCSPTAKIQNTLLFNEFERLIQSVEENNEDNQVKVQELRDMILKYGLPSTSGLGFENVSSLRSKVWKIVLGVPYALDVAKYLEKLEVWEI